MANENRNDETRGYNPSINYGYNPTRRPLDEGYQPTSQATETTIPKPPSTGSGIK